MKTIEKVFIVAGLVIILLVSGGIYINNKLNRLFDNTGMIGVILSEESSVRDEVIESNPDEKPESGRQGSKIENQPSVSAEDLIFDDDIEAIVQTKLDKPIERKDKIKVALILIRNLSVDEISYFYDLLTTGYTKEDIRKVRAILSANLNAEDMEVLRSMAAKYGFNL